VTLHNATQLCCFTLGVASRWVLGRGSRRAVRASIWFQIANLPAWFYMAVETRSWGLGALNVVYAVLYVRALLALRGDEARVER